MGHPLKDVLFDVDLFEKMSHSKSLPFKPANNLCSEMELLWFSLMVWVGRLSSEAVKITSGCTKAKRNIVSLDVQEMSKHLLFFSVNLTRMNLTMPVTFFLALFWSNMLFLLFLFYHLLFLYPHFFSSCVVSLISNSSMKWWAQTVTKYLIWSMWFGTAQSSGVHLTVMKQPCGREGIDFATEPFGFQSATLRPEEGTVYCAHRVTVSWKQCVCVCPRTTLILLLFKSALPAQKKYTSYASNSLPEVTVIALLIFFSRLKNPAPTLQSTLAKAKGEMKPLWEPSRVIRIDECLGESLQWARFISAFPSSSEGEEKRLLSVVSEGVPSVHIYAWLSRMGKKVGLKWVWWRQREEREWKTKWRGYRPLFSLCFTFYLFDLSLLKCLWLIWRIILWH